MIRKTSAAKFERHQKKWTSISQQAFPMCRADYVCDIIPKFPFKFADQYLYNSEIPRHGESRGPRDVPVSDFCNATDNPLPTELISLVNRGPNFRIPTNLSHKNVQETVQLFSG